MCQISKNNQKSSAFQFLYPETCRVRKQGRTKGKGGTAYEVSIAHLKRDGTRTETRLGLSAKQTRPFKSAGVSVQSTTGSRGVRISRQ